MDASRINTDSLLLTSEGVKSVEDNMSARHILDTEYMGELVSLFRSFEPHPVSGGHFFVVRIDENTGQAYVLDGKNVSTQRIRAVVADDGEVIFSRHQHDLRYSSDRSVYVDGGRSYTKTNVSDPSRLAEVRIIDSNESPLEVFPVPD